MAATRIDCDIHPAVGGTRTTLLPYLDDHWKEQVVSRAIDGLDLCNRMTRHIVARTTEIPPGGNKVVGIDGRDIVVFHVNGEYFALLNRCPHEGAPLDKAACVARLTSPEPGVYRRSRVGELLRCAWHGWEFDMRNGQSWFDPKRVKVRTYPVVIEDGETLAKGPYVAETFPVHIEDSYVIIET